MPDLGLCDLNFTSLLTLHASPFPSQRPCICFCLLLGTYFLLHPDDPVATFLSSFRSQLKCSSPRKAFLAMLARTLPPRLPTHSPTLLTSRHSVSLRNVCVFIVSHFTRGQGLFLTVSLYPQHPPENLAPSG